MCKIGSCLWVVRNEVFHGGMKPGRETDFLRKCNSLLKTIYRECFCDYVFGHEGSGAHYGRR